MLKCTVHNKIAIDTIKCRPTDVKIHGNIQRMVNQGHKTELTSVEGGRIW